LPFGSRVHLAFELWGNGKFKSPAEAWRSIMDANWKEAEEQQLFTEGWAKEDKLGQTMLEGYPDWLEESGEAAKYEVIGVESKLATELPIELPDGRVLPMIVRGKLDRRLRRLSDGAIYTGDYKTAASLSEDTVGNLLQSPQQRLYLLLERFNGEPGHWSAGFVLTVLRKVLRTAAAKPPFYANLRKDVSEADLAATWTNVTAMASEMMQVRDDLDNGASPHHVAPYLVSWECKTCPFRLPCFEMQNGNWQGASQMLADLYEVGDPFERYSDSEEVAAGG
jgi:hypothetical protein